MYVHLFLRVPRHLETSGEFPSMDDGAIEYRIQKSTQFSRSPRKLATCSQLLPFCGNLVSFPQHYRWHFGEDIQGFNKSAAIDGYKAIQAGIQRKTIGGHRDTEVKIIGPRTTDGNGTEWIDKFSKMGLDYLNSPITVAVYIFCLTAHCGRIQDYSRWEFRREIRWTNIAQW